MIRKILHRIIQAIACLLMLSCTDEIEKIHQSSSIFFTPDFQNSWTPLEQNGPKTSTRSNSSLMDTEELGTIYLHTLYTDSISPSFQQNVHSPLTRATPVNIDNMYNSFGVSAYAYIGEWDETRSPNYMYDVTVNKSGNRWSSSSVFYWPGEAYKMRFFAYAPRGNSAYQISGQIPGSPTITCTVPEKVEDQQDLLVASSAETVGNYNAAVSLTFRHALTAVKFVCGNDMKPGVVKSIMLKNIFSQGVYNMKQETWEVADTKVSFSQTLNKQCQGIVENEPITNQAQTFMMIPQTLAENAVIEVLFEDSEGEHILSGNIAKSQWIMGKTVTYKISTQSVNWEYTLTVTGTDDFTYQGGTNTYNITSYRTDGNGKQEPVAWTAEFSTDGSNWSSQKPEWLTAFTVGGSGSLSTSSYEATVSAVEGVTTNIHTEALRKKKSMGTESIPYDLSTNGSADTKQRNTANCYVVNAPGWYCFPLVYGNAVKGGENNTSAYISTQTGTYVLEHFINHLGNSISNPYINNNADCTVTAAELVWQDAKNLVNNITLEGNGEQAYIKFHVDPSTICQGNAVIAAKDATSVLWSWHIWVTDEDITKTKTVRNHASKTYQVMPVYVGWCDGDSTFYAKRACQVRIKTTGGTKIFKLSQSAGIVARGNSPYYQWGRKDPFFPSDGYENRSKTWYNAAGSASTSDPVIRKFFTIEEWKSSQDSLRENLASRCITLGIQNPEKMNGFQDMDKRYCNLWSVNNNKTASLIDDDNEVVKTVYDPCPSSFHLPPSNVFTGFYKTGNSEKDVANFNIKGSFNHGWTFYGNPDGIGDTVYCPALGSLFFETETSRSALGENARIWSAAVRDTRASSKGWISSFHTNPNGISFRTEYRYVGCSILGIRE